MGIYDVNLKKTTLGYQFDHNVYIGYQTNDNRVVTFKDLTGYAASIAGGGSGGIQSVTLEADGQELILKVNGQPTVATVTVSSLNPNIETVPTNAYVCLVMSDGTIYRTDKTWGEIDGNFLPLTAGASKPLTGVLYSTVNDITMIASHGKVGMRAVEDISDPSQHVGQINISPGLGIATGAYGAQMSAKDAQGHYNQIRVNDAGLTYETWDTTGHTQFSVSTSGNVAAAGIITSGGITVSLEGHTHSLSDVSGWSTIGTAAASTLAITNSIETDTAAGSIPNVQAVRNYAGKVTVGNAQANDEIIGIANGSSGTVTEVHHTGLHVTNNNGTTTLSPNTGGTLVLNGQMSGTLQLSLGSNTYTYNGSQDVSISLQTIGTAAASTMAIAMPNAQSAGDNELATVGYIKNSGLGGNVYSTLHTPDATPSSDRDTKFIFVED